MEKEIKVSVLMPVYNSEKFLNEAIESILNQSYTNLEFIIVNDGSTDKSLRIIKSYTDKRIKLINNVENKGIVYSLNKGLENCTGKYIVRMDSDDISYKTRIEEQVSYMEKNLDVVAAGTYIKIFGEKRKEKIMKNPILYEKIKVKSLFTVPIFHPTAILRREIFQKIGYTNEYDGYEDFDLWQRLIKAEYKISNLPKVLLKYRIVKTSISNIFQKKLEREYNKLKKVYKNSLVNILNDNNVSSRIIDQFTILNLTNLIPLKIKKSSDIHEYLELINYLIKENKNNKYYNEKYLKQYLYMRWSILIIKSKQFLIKYIINKEFIIGLKNLIIEKIF